MQLKKIVVIGPESTGKSTLCELLARHYHSDWVAEYAREYLLTNGKEYSYDNLLTIARGQILLEENHVSAALSNMPSGLPDSSSHPLFIDTDLYVVKVWCEFVFGRCHQWIIDQIATRQYDLYLLCNTDLPWVEDELREYPQLDMREKLFRMYKDILVNQGTAWAEIAGGPGQRLVKALSAVGEILR
jgi:NadR type nicotinamide-nucleotide adenylyltransferase